MSAPRTGNSSIRAIARGGTYEIEVQRSRFLCSISRVTDDEEAARFVARVRGEHRSASHNCFAFRVGTDSPSQRCDDDGEPSGTAGVPMLEVLVRRHLTDTAAVVTRYYGGVKLGAGGLVRAYGRAVSAAVDALGTVRRERFASLDVVVGHAAAGRLQNSLLASGHRIAEIGYAEEVTLTVLVRPSQAPAFREWLAARTGGAVAVVEGEPVDLDVAD